eukprot:g2401.t1
MSVLSSSTVDSADIAKNDGRIQFISQSFPSQNDALVGEKESKDSPIRGDTERTTSVVVSKTNHVLLDDNVRPNIAETNEREATSSFSIPSKEDVVLCVYIQGERAIGAASYDRRAAEIATTQIFTWKEDIDFSLTRLRMHVEPTTILISQRITSAHLQTMTSSRYVFEDATNDAEEGEDGDGKGGNETVRVLDGGSEEKKEKETTPASIPYVVLKTSAFSRENALRLLRRLYVSVPASSSSTFSPYANVERKLDLSNDEMIRACGALLTYISNKYESQQLRGDALPVTVSCIAQYSLKDYVYVDDLAFKSLDIFEAEGGSKRSKEGFSLFMTLNRTCTSKGQRLLRNWMRKPILTPHVLCERHRAVEYLSQQQVMNYYPMFASHLRKTFDLSRIVLRIKKAEGSVRDWRNLKLTLEETHKLSDLSRVVLSQMDERRRVATENEGVGGETRKLYDGVLRRVCSATSEELATVLREIDRTIDFERSAEKGRMCIRDNVDEDLDEIRHFLAGLEDYLANVTNEDARVLESMYPGMMRDLPWEYQYRPQIGFFVAIAAASDMADDPVTTTTANEEFVSSRRQRKRMRPTDPPPSTAASSLRSASASPRPVPASFEFVFRSNGAYCYRTPRTAELDATFGDLASKEIDLEQALMIRLEDRVLASERTIVDVGIMLSELDVLYAYAICAYDYKLVRPELTDENKLVAKKARHVLQEQTVDSFVPNDVMLQPENGFAMSIITGPNYSGKSVYLKSVGLVAYMAFIGHFVPAERALVGPVDRIFCRVKSYESVTLGLSTFQIDCAQMSRILNCATERSLVLIDEFGKGTNVADGLALFAASCDALLTQKASENSPPKVVTVTHFNEALDLPCLKRRRVPVGTGILHLHMHTIREKRRIVPLFKLRPVGGQSTKDGDGSSRGSDGGGTFDTADAFASAKADYGIFCAEQAGVSARVVERAREIFECIENSKPIAPAERDRFVDRSSSGGADASTTKATGDCDAIAAAAATTISRHAQYEQLLRQFLHTKSWLDCESAVVDGLLEKLPA